MNPTNPPLPVEGLEAWGRFHLAAHGRMTDLAEALLARDGARIGAALAWVRDELGPHEAAEARCLRPLLEAAQAASLGARLQQDHVRIGDLVRDLPGDEAGREKAARQLLDLVRQHADTEAFAAVPLLKDRGLIPEDAFGSRDPRALEGWARWRNLPGSGR